MSELRLKLQFKRIALASAHFHFSCQAISHMRIIRLLLAALFAASFVGCDLQKEADAKFGDQHFKTVIALVELHKVRNGAYPDTLKDIQFTGEWDPIALASVDYKRMESGYELNVTRGWVAKPELFYPATFWRGLGLIKSNMKPSP